MATENPHVLLEMSDEPDCRFVAAWLSKAAVRFRPFGHRHCKIPNLMTIFSFFTATVSPISQPRHSRSLENWNTTVTSLRSIFTNTKMACSALNL